MKAIEILMAEHRVIEGVLDVLERAADAVETGHGVPAQLFLDAAEFIRAYADDAHHRKEEGILFEAMVRCGFPERQGPIAVMLGEHAQARELTRALAESARRLQAGETAAGIAAAQHARAYAALLRAHIHKEDNVLYVMARRILPASEQEQMVAEFERVERDEVPAGTRAKYEALAAALARRQPACAGAHPGDKETA